MASTESMADEPSKVGINDLPPELHDKIVDEVAMDLYKNLDLFFGGKTCRDDVKSCALTQRGWRRRAQQCLHRCVAASSRNYPNVLCRYTSVPASGNTLAMDLSQFPTILEWTGNLFVPTELLQFADRCGDRIATLRIDSFKTVDLKAFMQFVSIFPSLRKLEVAGELECSEDINAVQDIPSVPRLLQTLIIKDILPAPLVHWLSQIVESNISTVNWSCLASDEAALAASSALFRAIGPSLTQLDLRLYFEAEEELAGSCPDLSNNTNLVRLKVMPQQPLSSLPWNIFSSLVDGLSSPVLEHLEICLALVKGDDLEPDFVDYSAFDRLAHPSNRFPRLKTVRFVFNRIRFADVCLQTIASDIRDQAPRLFKSSVRVEFCDHFTRRDVHLE